MSNVFLEELGIQPAAYNLGIGGGSHGENTGSVLEAFERVLVAESPSLVLVYGDTDSTLAAAIAASKLCIPVGHVEAGLRSFNRRMPEGINRIVTDHVSRFLFAPSSVSVENMANEGIRGEHVRLVGDVMYVAVIEFAKLAEQRSNVLGRLGLRPRGHVLATLHRKENTDDVGRLSAILDGLAEGDEPVVMPLHPRTRKRIGEFGLKLHPRIRIIDLVGYLDMTLLERMATLIATDSGGVQKEAYFHGVPCVTLRDETEWVELVDLGANRLVGAHSKAIREALREHRPLVVGTNVYGAGNAATAIAGFLAGRIDLV